MKGKIMDREDGLTGEEKVELLRAARGSIEELLAAGMPSRGEPEAEGLKERRGGAFVSLHKGEKLRGCIGTFSDRGRLFDTVKEMAVSAAAHDPRFLPVAGDEVPQLTIEISALAPMREIGSIEEIEVGKHGLYITRGFSSGVLLPQVATEYGWNRQEFLDHTCMKAGLLPDAWKQKGTKIYVFTAEVFSEEDIRD